MFEGAGNNPGEKTLEDKFFEHEVKDDKYLIVFALCDYDFRYKRFEIPLYYRFD